MSERIQENPIKHIYQGVVDGNLHASDILAGASTKLVNAKKEEARRIKEGIHDEGQAKLAINDAMQQLVEVVANLPDRTGNPSIVEILKELHR